VKVEILRDAQEELDASIAYYEDIEAGLGVRLKEEVRAAIRWIGKNPDVPRLRAKGYHRVTSKCFSTMSLTLRGLKRFGLSP
jgi:hypothetical protein